MNKNALSISSHVSHGYVGNRATVFLLQYMGWNVDELNTTNFSNHPGYGKFRGMASKPYDIGDVLEGLKSILDFNDEFDMILTGYTPNASMLEIIYSQLTSEFKKHNSHKHPIWVVDPVLGDNGKLYVASEVVPIIQKIYKSGYVSLTTPNQFEFELLSNTEVHDWETLKKALTNFRSLYPIPYVVITSVDINDKLYSVGADFISKKTFYFEIKKINASFSGSGDVFTALLANVFSRNGNVLVPDALGDTNIKLQKILQHSFEMEQKKTKQKEIQIVRDIRIVTSRKVLDEDYSSESSKLVSYL